MKYDIPPKTRRDEILSMREYLKIIVEKAQKWAKDVEDKGDMRTQEVVAGNLVILNQFSAVILSLDARLQILENEVILKIKRQNLYDNKK